MFRSVAICVMLRANDVVEQRREKKIVLTCCSPDTHHTCTSAGWLEESRQWLPDSSSSKHSWSARWAAESRAALSLHRLPTCRGWRSRPARCTDVSARTIWKIRNYWLEPADQESLPVSEHRQVEGIIEILGRNFPHQVRSKLVIPSLWERLLTWNVTAQQQSAE